MKFRLFREAVVRSKQADVAADVVPFVSTLNFVSLQAFYHIYEFICDLKVFKLQEWMQLERKMAIVYNARILNLEPMI